MIVIGGEFLDLKDAHIHFQVRNKHTKKEEFVNIALEELPEITASNIEKLIKKI